MKFTKLIFLFSLSLATISCSSDDDNVETYKLSSTNFVDTYKMKFLELKEVETITFGNGTTSTSTSTTVGSVFQNVNYAFNSNNSYAATGLFNITTTVKEANGSTTVGDPVIVNLDEAGTYSLNTTNNSVTLTDTDGVVKAFEITKYTETEMILYAEETIVSNNSSIKTTLEYRFTR